MLEGVDDEQPDAASAQFLGDASPSLNLDPVDDTADRRRRDVNTSDDPAGGRGEGSRNLLGRVMDQHAADNGGTNTQLVPYEPPSPPSPRRRQRPVEERIALAEHDIRRQDAAHQRRLDWALYLFAVGGAAAAVATAN